MSTIHIPTSFNISITFPAAPFHRRLAAWFIDGLVVYVMVYLLRQMYISLVQNMPYDSGEHEVAEGIYNLVRSLVFFVYHPFCEFVFKGQSVGKRLMQLRVINDRGGRPSLSQVFIRSVIRTSDILVVLLILLIGIFSGSQQAMTMGAILFLLFAADIILVNVSKRNQRLGDLLAHTLIIRTTQRAAINETIFQHVTDTYTPVYPQVMQLSDRDINAVKNILDSARKHHDFNLAERAANKIKGHLRIETDMSPYDFLEILLKDYNYLTTH